MAGTNGTFYWISRLALGTNGQVLTISGGVPVWSVGSSYSDPMTTRGDTIYRNSSNITARLPIGSSGYVLTSNGTDVSWAASTAGFADPMTTRGDIIYRNAANNTTRLAAGANTYVLTSNGTDISWAAPGAGDVVGPASATDNAVARYNLTTGKLIQDSIVTISDTGEIAGGIHLALRDDASLPGAPGNMVVLENRNDTPASHAHLEFRKARAANANLANGDEVGGINFYGRHNSTTTSLIDIVGVYTGNGTTRTGDLTFLLSSASTPTERMRLTGAGSLQLSALTASRALATDSSKGLVSSTTTDTELGYLSGVTSALQTQLNAKAPLAGPTFTGTVSGITAAMVGAPSGSGTSSGTNTGDQTITLTGAVTGSGTGSFATTLASGIDATKIADGSVTSTEFQYINTVTSNVQTQLNSKPNMGVNFNIANSFYVI